jgi:hypothetical protein
VGPTCRRQFPSLVRSLSLPLSLSLSLSRGPGSPVPSRCPACPLFSLYAVDLPCQFRLLRARRGPACAHSRTSLGFLATTPAHAPSSLFRALSVPHAHPSPHFTHPRPLSRSALAAGDPRPRPRPSSSPETAPSLPELRPEVRHPSPCPIFLIEPYVRPISPSLVLDRGGPPCSHGGRPI